MKFDDFFQEAERRNLRLPPAPRETLYRSSLENEALFQLPLLAMAILTISKGRSKPVVEEIGQLVGECLERTVAGFKGSSQDIGWSANLRIRTVKALTFLERSGFAIIDARTRSVSATAAGRELINSAVRVESPLSDALYTFERSYENINAERKIRQEVLF
jgi:hypothetical protein